ncbi:unnamed protein product, partial [Brassica rapa]
CWRNCNVSLSLTVLISDNGGYDIVLSSLCPLSSSTQVPLPHSPKPFFSLKEKKITAFLLSIGTPQDSGISLQTVLEIRPHVPLFGYICSLRTNCTHKYTKNKYCWSLFSSPFLVGRYHSLVIQKDSFPSDELEVTAWTEDGLVMAARHRKHKHIQVNKNSLKCFMFLLTSSIKNRSF